MFFKKAFKRVPVIIVPMMLMVLLSLSGVARGETTFIVPSDEYPTITSAVEAADDGDTIYVQAGVYYEDVYIIDKDLSLLGDGQNVTFVQGIYTLSSFPELSGITDLNASDVVEPHCTDGDCTEYALWCEMVRGGEPICLWHNKEKKAITLCAPPRSVSELMQHHPDACYGTCYYVFNYSAVCNDIE